LLTDRMTALIKTAQLTRCLDLNAAEGKGAAGGQTEKKVWTRDMRKTGQLQKDTVRAEKLFEQSLSQKN